MKNYDEIQLQNCLARVQEAKEQLEIIKHVLIDFGCEWNDNLLIKTSASSQQNCNFIDMVLSCIEAHIEADIIDVM